MRWDPLHADGAGCSSADEGFSVSSLLIYLPFPCTTAGCMAFYSRLKWCIYMKWMIPGSPQLLLQTNMLLGTNCSQPLHHSAPSRLPVWSAEHLPRSQQLQQMTAACQVSGSPLSHVTIIYMFFMAQWVIHGRVCEEKRRCLCRICFMSDIIEV